MLSFARLMTHPRKLYRMTGLTLEQFQKLSARLSPLWQEAEQARLSERNRRHKIGQGRKYKLATLQDKLLCLLVFYRFYLTDELLGELVGLDASNVCRLQQRLEPLLEKAADDSLGAPLKRRLSPAAKKIGTWEKLLEVCPQFAELVTDATEQPRNRPAKRAQRRWYSGKKKRHTIKTEITVNKTSGRILRVSKSVPGRMHDYALFKREGSVKQLPPQARHWLDKGYDGAQADYPQQHLILPVKKRRNLRLLSRAQRRFNRLHAKARIMVEHVLSRVKKYQVLAQIYRHRIADYNRRFRNVAALTNFRLATPAV